MRKRDKAKHTMKKKVILKDNITTKYIEYIHTEILGLVVMSPFAYPNYNVLIHPQNIEKQYH